MIANEPITSVKAAVAMLVATYLVDFCNFQVPADLTVKYPNAPPFQDVVSQFD
jgi:hypothetical protein